MRQYDMRIEDKLYNAKGIIPERLLRSSNRVSQAIPNVLIVSSFKTVLLWNFHPDSEMEMLLERMPR
jgi:hypothetical protein